MKGPLQTASMLLLALAVVISPAAAQEGAKKDEDQALKKNTVEVREDIGGESS